MDRYDVAGHAGAQPVGKPGQVFEFKEVNAFHSGWVGGFDCANADRLTA